MSRPDPLPPGSRKPLPVPHPTRRQLSLFLRHIGVGASDDCWLWQLCKNEYGYGRVRVGVGPERRLVYAHRLAYAIWNGDGLVDYTVDHTCRNPACCNPAHLQRVTDVENRELVRVRASNDDVPF